MSDPEAHRPVVYVDADACPVKAEICHLAAEAEVDAVFVASFNHEIANTVSGVEVVTVDNEPEAADIAIANRLAKGDIVITQDFGLAAMCLGRGAHAISPRGVVYDNGNINRLLAERHETQKIRRRGGRLSGRGPRPYSQQDLDRFTSTLARLLNLEQ